MSRVRAKECEGVRGHHDDKLGWIRDPSGRWGLAVTGRMSGSCRVSPPMGGRGSIC